MSRHDEDHRVANSGWLRAAVLGANDGIVSTASLIVGVAASGATPQSVLVTGVAGLFAGSMSMAAGEYVSVSAQADSETAERKREEIELATTPEAEHEELVQIYQRRGLDRATAEQVATQMTAFDAVGTHLRDELGMTHATRARPAQAALASGVSFAIGSALPLLVVLIAPARALEVVVAGSAILFLALLGIAGAKAGGANPVVATLRVTFWGGVALAVTAGIGTVFRVVG